MYACVTCGTKENVNIVETNNGAYTLTKCICIDCYEKSKGKRFVDLFKNNPAFYSDEGDIENNDLTSQNGQ